MKHKKGFFFTMAAIALSIVMILSFNVYETKTRNEKNEVIAVRVLTLNDFVKDAENDMEKGVYIISKRTLLGIQEYITEEGKFLSSAGDAFEEGMMAGSIEGEDVSFLVNATFADWAKRIGEEANKADILANITVQSIAISQQDPWNLNVTVNLLVNVTDKRKVASWSRPQQVSSKVSILDLEDPLYVVKTNGKVTNTVRLTNYTPFVALGEVSNLISHMNGSFYIPSNQSPSYLMRLSGNLSPSPVGIESLVNVQKLLANGVQTADRSIADSVYFGSLATINYRINNTPSWFKIDADRLDMYGVANLTI